MPRFGSVARWKVCRLSLDALPTSRSAGLDPPVEKSDQTCDYEHIVILLSNAYTICVTFDHAEVRLLRSQSLRGSAHSSIHNHVALRATIGVTCAPPLETPRTAYTIRHQPSTSNTNTIPSPPSHSTLPRTTLTQCLPCFSPTTSPRPRKSQCPSRDKTPAPPTCPSTYNLILRSTPHTHRPTSQWSVRSDETRRSQEGR